MIAIIIVALLCAFIAYCICKSAEHLIDFFYGGLEMTTIISEQTKQELLALAESLNDIVNDIYRQVRLGEVFSNDLDLWLELKHKLEE